MHVHSKEDEKEEDKEKLPEDIITKKLLEGEIPIPNDVRALLGDEEIILKSFYFSLALLHNISRRDAEKPSFVHSLSVAAKPDYRYDDSKIPSGFRQTTYMKCLGLIHESREEFGQTILGSYVVQDCVAHSLGDGLAEGLDYMTNTNDIVMGSIEGQLKSLARSDKEKFKRLKPEHISKRLHDKLKKLKVDEKSVNNNYRRYEANLKKFLGDMDTYHPYLRTEDKMFITDIIYPSFIEPISKRLEKRGILGASELAGTVKRDFEYIISIIEGNNYLEADPKLILSSESPVLATLKKTFYQDFLDRMICHAFNKLKEEYAKGQLSDDSSLSIPIVKGCDSTAYIVTLESDIMRAIHQFRKARRVRASNRRLINSIKRKGVSPEIYHRLEKSNDYLDKNLKSSFKDHYRDFSSKHDSIFIKDIELLEYMLSKENTNQKPQITSP